MGFSVHKSMNLDQNLPSSILAQASSEVKLIWKYSNSTSSLSEILTSYSFKHLVIRRTGISPTGSLQMLHADSSSIFSYFCSIYSLNSWRCLLAVFQLEKKKNPILVLKKKPPPKFLTEVWGCNNFKNTYQILACSCKSNTQQDLYYHSSWFTVCNYDRIW